MTKLIILLPYYNQNPNNANKVEVQTTKRGKSLKAVQKMHSELSKLLLEDNLIFTFHKRELVS